MDSPSFPRVYDSHRVHIRGGQGEVIPDTGFNICVRLCLKRALVPATRTPIAIAIAIAIAISDCDMTLYASRFDTADLARERIRPMLLTRKHRIFGTSCEPDFCPRIFIHFAGNVFDRCPPSV